MVTKKDLYKKLRSVNALYAAVEKIQGAKKSVEQSMLESSLTAAFPDEDPKQLDELASDIARGLAYEVNHALITLQEKIEGAGVKKFKIVDTDETDIAQEENDVYFRVTAEYPSTTKWEVAGEVPRNKIMAEAIKDALSGSYLKIDKNKVAKAVVDSKAFAQVMKTEAPKLNTPKGKRYNLVELSGVGMSESFEEFFYENVDTSVDWDEDEAPDVNEFPFEHRTRQDTNYTVTVTSMNNSKVLFSYIATTKGELEWGSW